MLCFIEYAELLVKSVIAMFLHGNFNEYYTKVHKVLQDMYKANRSRQGKEFDEYIEYSKLYIKHLLIYRALMEDIQK